MIYFQIDDISVVSPLDFERLLPTPAAEKWFFRFNLMGILWAKIFLKTFVYTFPLFFLSFDLRITNFFSLKYDFIGLCKRI